MANYDSFDLDFTWDGDLFTGSDGDLADNKDDSIRSLEIEIHSILKSETGDWEMEPGLGAQLSDYLGEPNTRENGKRIEDRVISRITATGIVDPNDIRVRVIPVQLHKIMIIIQINATATPSNRLSSGEPLAVNLLYDSIENNLFFLQESRLVKQARDF